MGYNQESGNIDEIPTGLYWRLGDMHCSTVTEQELVHDIDGNPLDTDGVAIQMIDGTYPGDAEFQYAFQKKIKWHVTMVAFLSKDESDEYSKSSKRARKSEVFEFTESKDLPADFSGSPLAAMYKHPLLQAMIPEDWEPDI